MSKPVRKTLLLCAQGLPAAGAAVVTAFLAPFGIGAAACLAALAGAGAWAGSLRRNSTLLPAPGRFIGS
ncbi:MAG: hypothetical protein ICV73_26905 [Acetobacteraceae bacterium]|nr:hypothetical protein [Acetobacteraceae bacterium]